MRTDPFYLDDLVRETESHDKAVFIPFNIEYHPAIANCIRSWIGCMNLIKIIPKM